MFQPEQPKWYYGEPLTDRLLGQVGEHLSGGVLGCRWEEGFPFFYVNQNFLDFTGYSYSEFLALTGGYIMDVIHPDDRAVVTAMIHSSLMKKNSYQVEYRIRHKNGSWVWLHAAGRRIMDELGEESIVSVSTDITESVHLRAALEATSRELRVMLDDIPCGICKVRVDAELSIQYANEFFYGIFGYTPAQAMACGFVSASFILYAADWTKMYGFVCSEVGKGSLRFEVEHRYIHKSGEIRWMLARFSRRLEEPEMLTGAVLDITDRKKTEERLRFSEEESRIAVRHTGNTIDIYEVATHTLIQPQEAADWFGVSPVLTDMPRAGLASGRILPTSHEAYTHFYECMNRGEPSGSAVLQIRDPNGQLRWLDGQFTMLYDEDGAPSRAVVSYEDITVLREKELAYQKWSQYFETQQEGTIAYYEYNLTKDVYERSENIQMTELPPEIRTFCGTVSYMAEHFIWPEDMERYLDVFDRKSLLMQFYEGRREVRLEHRRKTPTGEPFWAMGLVQLIPDPYSTDVKAFVMIRNIDEEKQKALRLQDLSERDTLTGVFNRRMVEDKTTSNLAESPPGVMHALVMMDIDHFKQLNDSFGHRFGDRVIRDLAEKLQHQLQEGEFCGRMGGDEFVSFLCNLEEGALTLRLEALVRQLRHDYGERGVMSVSVGAACFPRDGTDFDTLYQKADLALYEAKRGGRCQYAVFDPGPPSG